MYGRTESLRVSQSRFVDSLDDDGGDRTALHTKKKKHEDAVDDSVSSQLSQRKPRLVRRGIQA